MIMLAALLLAGQSRPHPFPIHVGECRWVHGQFISANGSGIRRIWVIGTKHILYLHDLDKDVPDPRFAYENMQAPADLYDGDFYVCALQKFVPGDMQPVRLKAVKKLIALKNEAS